MLLKGDFFSVYRRLWIRKKTLSKRTNQSMDLFTLCVGYMSLSTDRGECVGVNFFLKLLKENVAIVEVSPARKD